MNPTPILDREAPLPSPVAHRNDLTVVVAAWLALIGVVAISLFIGWPPIVRRSLLAFAGQLSLEPRTVAVSALGACVGILAVHELGHVLGGLLVGFRFHSLRIGPVQIDRPFRISLYKGPGAAFTGAAMIVPVATDNLVRNGIVMVGAGPAANVLAGALVLILPFAGGVFWNVFAVASIANGLMDLLPFRSPVGLSDGRVLGMLLSGREGGERWLALLNLRADIMAGVLPESLSPDFLAKAMRIEDASLETVFAHAFAYSAAFHQHDDARGAQMLEVGLRHAGHAPPSLREAFMSDAAVFQGRRRKRADLAKQWLADIPDRSAKWLRFRVEAAIAEAEGDIARASSKLAECEKAFLELPDGAQKELLLRMLRRWQAELVAEG